MGRERVIDCADCGKTVRVASCRARCTLCQRKWVVRWFGKPRTEEWADRWLDDGFLASLSVDGKGA